MYNYSIHVQECFFMSDYSNRIDPTDKISKENSSLTFYKIILPMHTYLASALYENILLQFQFLTISIYSTNCFTYSAQTIYFVDIQFSWILFLYQFLIKGIYIFLYFFYHFLFNIHVFSKKYSCFSL